MELNEKEINNNYPNNKLKYDISEYKEVDLVDFLIDYMQWLNKKILIKNIPIKDLDFFSLSNKKFVIFCNDDMINCSFESLDRERIIELNKIFVNKYSNYNKFLNIYCVVLESDKFLKLDNFTINQSKRF